MKTSLRFVAISVGIAVVVSSAALAASISKSEEAGVITGFEAAQSVSAAPCDSCPDRCAGETNECKAGSIKACYLAAACMCQCNLDAGGCGSEKDALRDCVRDNKKNARNLE